MTCNRKGGGSTGSLGTDCLASSVFGVDRLTVAAAFVASSSFTSPSFLDIGGGAGRGGGNRGSAFSSDLVGLIDCWGGRGGGGEGESLISESREGDDCTAWGSVVDLEDGVAEMEGGWTVPEWGRGC